MTVPQPFKLEGTRNIILDTIKRAEDDHFGSNSKEPQTVILRLYEAFGGHGDVSLVTSLPVESATIVDVRDPRRRFTFASHDTDRFVTIIRSSSVMLRMHPWFNLSSGAPPRRPFASRSAASRS